MPSTTAKPVGAPQYTRSTAPEWHFKAPYYVDDAGMRYFKGLCAANRLTESQIEMMPMVEYIFDYVEQEKKVAPFGRNKDGKPYKNKAGRR
jgi:hypothetical protein